LVDSRQNGVDIDKWIDMIKPQGVDQIPAPAKYYETVRIIVT
jgi:hypothetical protein